VADPQDLLDSSKELIESQFQDEDLCFTERHQLLNPCQEMIEPPEHGEIEESEEEHTFSRDNYSSATKSYHNGVPKRLFPLAGPDKETPFGQPDQSMVPSMYDEAENDNQNSNILDEQEQDS